MKFKWRKPPPSLSVTLQFGFTAFKGIKRNIRQAMKIALGLAALFFPFFDRINTFVGEGAPLFSLLSSFLERDVLSGAQAHLPPSTMNGDAKVPLPATI